MPFLASNSVATLIEGMNKEMVLIKRKIIVAILTASAVLVGSCWVSQQALAQKTAQPGASKQGKRLDAPAPAAQKAFPATKLDLKPSNFRKFQTLIRPSGQEWRHLKVHWLTDIVAAHKKAAREDKPLLTLDLGGAGYNDALGVC